MCKYSTCTYIYIRERSCHRLQLANYSFAWRWEWVQTFFRRGRRPGQGLLSPKHITSNYNNKLLIYSHINMCKQLQQIGDEVLGHKTILFSLSDWREREKLHKKRGRKESQQTVCEEQRSARKCQRQITSQSWACKWLIFYVSCIWLKFNCSINNFEASLQWLWHQRGVVSGNKCKGSINNSNDNNSSNHKVKLGNWEKQEMVPNLPNCCWSSGVGAICPSHCSKGWLRLGLLMAWNNHCSGLCKNMNFWGVLGVLLKMYGALLVQKCTKSAPKVHQKCTAWCEYFDIWGPIPAQLGTFGGWFCMISGWFASSGLFFAIRQLAGIGTSGLHVNHMHRDMMRNWVELLETKNHFFPYPIVHGFALTSQETVACTYKFGWVCSFFFGLQCFQ